MTKGYSISIDEENVRDDTEQLARGLIDAQEEGMETLVEKDTIVSEK